MACPRKPGPWLGDTIQLLVANCEEMIGAALPQNPSVEFAGSNVKVQGRASNRVMAADTEQPREDKGYSSQGSIDGWRVEKRK